MKGSCELLITVSNLTLNMSLLNSEFCIFELPKACVRVEKGVSFQVKNFPPITPKRELKQSIKFKFSNKTIPDEVSK